MLRTDRLFEIINMLRTADGPLPAASIAAELEVTPRTVYRYIAALQSMRIPIEGAVGIGYVMRRGYDLPPLNFDDEELESIIIGLGLLARTGDSGLQKAAKRVMTKIETNRVSADSLRVSNWGIIEPGDALLNRIRGAIREETKLQLNYEDLDGHPTSRTILPLTLTYFVEVALVSGWCELRKDFRSFRVDRISKCRVLTDTFKGEGKQLRLEMDANGSSPRLNG